MTDNNFDYRPKFVDIRVKKPGSAKTAAAAAAAPDEKLCDYTDCKKPGQHKAPKSRDRDNEFWFFCSDHASDYNKRWNYFAGMSAGEFKAYQAREEVGHRPTWTFRSGKGDRLSAAAIRGARKDPFGVFGATGEAATPAAKPARRLTKLQMMSFEVMQLEEGADAAQIRARYAELVKRWHPDSNGGDRSAESNLQKVVQAYQRLKASGLV